MKESHTHLRVVSILIFLGLLVLQAACSSTQPGSSSLVGAATDLPTISAAGCTLAIQGFQLSDRYPPGCVSGSKNCLQLSDGEELLLVFFKAQGSCNLQTLTDQTAFERELYLLALDGTRSERIVTGVEGDVFTLGFSLASPPNNLLLVWASNPKIKLPAVSK